MRAPLFVLPLCAFLLGGCVDAEVVVNLLPDGSGSFEIDVGYDRRAWPTFFGDPLEGWARQEQLQAFSDPGLGPWSEPEIVVDDIHRRLRTEVFFDDLDDVQVLGSDDGRLFVALAFTHDSVAREVRMHLGVREALDDPLPLPTPEQAGMDVSISESLLAAIRQEIRPVIEGARLKLVARLPGEVERADAFDTWEGRQARLEADADRIALALRERAGILLDEETLDARPLRVRWASAPPREAEAESLRARRRAALEWWGTFAVRRPLPR